MDINLSEWKNKIVRYLVQSHIGHLFKDGTLEAQQISVDLSSGNAYLRQLELDVEFLNEVGDQLNFPLRVVKGYLEELHIHAPWRNFFSDGLSLATEFHGLHLTFEPIEDIDDAASMWSSAIGRLVEKSSTYKNDCENPVLLNEGAKKVDDFFRYLMSKLTIHFKDTVICLQPRNSELGLKLSIKLKSLRFYDENETSENVPEKEYGTKNRGAGYHSNTAYTTKIVDIQGVSLWVAVPSEDVRSHKQMNEQSNIEPENKKPNEHEIMFAVLSDKQKIKIFIKQTDSEDGPGLRANTTLGDLLIFLTPRQVYLLTEFMREYCEIDDIDRYQQKTRPMTTSDYQRVESMLQQQNTQYMGLQMGHGWSSLPTEDTEQQFHSMITNHPFDLECGMSVAGSIDDSSSVHSTIFSERPSTVTRMNSRGMTTNYSRAMSAASSCVPRTSHDPGRDIFQINLHISSLAAILLHEDILNVTEGGERYTQDSISKLQELSSKFFENIMDSNLSHIFLEEDDDEVKRVLDQNCSLNHIRLLSAPVHFSLKVDPQKKEYEGSIKTYRLTLSECLYEDNSTESVEIPLLIFEDPLQECLSISMITRRNYSPRSDLVITFNRCAVELDITIMDRLSALLNLLYSCQGEEQAPSIQSKDTTNFVIDVPYAEIKLRFPIPDFSPLHDPKRIPWWKRNVRPDYMTLKCYNLKFHRRLSSQNKSQADEYSFEFEVLDIYYNEPGRKKPIFFAQIGDKDHKYEPCRFVVKIFPTKTLYDVTEREDPATEKTFCKDLLQKMDNGPFTSKKIFHQSRSEHLYEAFPEQDFLIPGDRKEIEEFKSSTKESTKLVIDITLSSVKIQIVSKHTYEMIYNRINNDLLMWEPSAPKSRFSPKKKEVMFEECRSAPQFHHYDSESEDYSDNEDYSLFYSTHEGPKLDEDNSTEPIKKYVDQSNMLIDLKITNGTIAFNPPVRDASLNVIPGQLGYIAIDLSEANVFMVSGYKGDSALDYVCVDVKSCDMRHHEMMPSSEVRICLPNLKKIPSHLHPVISKSVGTLMGDRREQDRHMLTVAFKILKRHETHHVKTVKIALGLNKSTLHHRVTAAPNSWVSQLIDFFKVTDFPIAGYKSKDVLSEFHLHTWDCAIDYRPLHLPLRCAVTLASFNMTSNVSEYSKGSKLRFIAEDSDVYISQDNPPKDGIPSNIPMDLRREYVNVVTLNMFELSLTLNDKSQNNGEQCSLDLRVSTDCLKIHSCADSLKALTDLIGYIAGDGDLTCNESIETNSAHASPRHGPGDETLVSVEPQIPEINEVPEWQRRQINDLISQAIEDETEEKIFKPVVKDGPSGNRYFPQVQRELGDVNALSDDDIESSFVIVDDINLHKEKFTYLKRLKDPMKLNRQSMSSPEMKRSSLKTPLNFPVAVNKYTLCEMNILWQLYGGRDFLTPQEKKKEKKDKPLYNELYANHFSSTESLYSRNSSSSSPRERRISERDWKDAGGINRNKDVLMEVNINQLGCQYEVYPKSTLQANRFVLHIKEYEIVDKMKSSEFNKFLCQYVSELNPKQTQGHMFSINALNIRPPEMMGETECSVTFSLLPLRLYIDQESLEFMIQFFSEMGLSLDEEKGKSSSKQSTPLHQAPKLVVKCKQEENEEPLNDGDENLINLDNFSTEQRSISPEINSSEDDSNWPRFFRPVIFASESFVKIDYKGKYVSRTDGSLTGLLMGFIMGLAEINNSEIKLKKIVHKTGMLGMDNVLNYIMQEWLNDIKKNQLQNVLIGVGPMQAIVKLLSGFRDLVWLPIEQYQKDGRIVKGLRRGANSFSTSTAIAALELTRRFILLVQATAETAYDILSPGQSVRLLAIEKKKKKRYKQPQDIREGVANALWVVKEGLGETAEVFAHVAVQEHEHKGYVGVVGGIARQIPPNLIKPIIIASEATNNVLGGIKSQLIPDAKTEANQKWRNFE